MPVKANYQRDSARVRDFSLTRSPGRDQIPAHTRRTDTRQRWQNPHARTQAHTRYVTGFVPMLCAPGLLCSRAAQKPSREIAEKKEPCQTAEPSVMCPCNARRNFSLPR
jgi:hypothetical protein